MKNTTMYETTLDMMKNVAGGKYDVDESNPHTQAFIAECKKLREMYMSRNLPMGSQMALDMVHDAFGRCGCFGVLEWWQEQDIMDKYFLGKEVE